VSYSGTVFIVRHPPPLDVFDASPPPAYTPEMKKTKGASEAQVTELVPRLDKRVFLNGVSWELVELARSTLEVELDGNWHLKLLDLFHKIDSVGHRVLHEANREVLLRKEAR
jgi:hypothetical protein